MAAGKTHISPLESPVEPLSFALVGAAGYIAPKHMKAIRDTGHSLVAAVDKNDSVGIIDSYFPKASFFTEVERFDRHLEKIKRAKPANAVRYVSICSPNYLHDAHCRLAMRVGAHAICEKPLVINPWNLDQLCDLENEYGQRIYNVLQLRLHPAVRALKDSMTSARTSTKKPEIRLTYVTRRGKWYFHSWKGDVQRSGGIAMNIGVHFFDFLIWVFGSVESSELHLKDDDRMAGHLELDRARVRWFLSVSEEDLPQDVKASGGYAFRSLTIDEKDIDLSAGFTDLHTDVYRDILSGGGFGIEAARPAINLVYQLRTAEPVTSGEAAHPFLSGQGPVGVAK